MLEMLGIEDQVKYSLSASLEFATLLKTGEKTAINVMKKYNRVRE